MTIDTTHSGLGPGSEPAPDREPRTPPFAPDTTTGVATEKAPEFDEATEKRLVRKMDMRLVLLAFLCCMTQSLEACPTAR